MKYLSGIRILWAIRILAGLFVLTVVAITVTLTYHVRVSPLDGKLSEWFPEPGSMDPHREAILYAQSLESRELPDIEPGEQAFRKAMEMMAMGRTHEAHEKLTTIFSIFPNSSVARSARRIVGDMNMDELLGSRTGFGREIYKVKPGDSYLAIAARHNTTIEMMIHLNAMQRLKGIQPGHELIVMPLNMRLLVEPRRQVISIWDEERFLKEYPVLSMKGVPSRPTKTSIKAKIAELNGGNIPSHHESYSAANKIIQLTAGNLQIRGWDQTAPEAVENDSETESESTDDEGEEDEIPHGILIEPHHMEELALLTRKGNSVEIR